MRSKFPGLLLAASLMASLSLLTMCGGGASQPNTQLNPPATPVSLAVRDTPPPNITVLSFEMTVDKALLQPGNVPLVPRATRIEVKRLETETAFLSTNGVPAGTYNSIDVSFSHPELTILNNSGTSFTVGGKTCVNNQVCEFAPPLTASASYAGAPFPITVVPGTPVGLVVDLNVEQSLQADLSIKPVITVATSTTRPGEWEHMDDVVGRVTAVDATNKTFTLQSGMGQSWLVTTDANTEYEDFDEAGLTNGFGAIAVEQILKVDVALLQGGTLLAKEVELAEHEAEGELEGVIVALNGPLQFEMVVTDDFSGMNGMGNKFTVTLTSDAKFSVRPDNLTITSGLSFATAADLMAGQHVELHPLSLATMAVTADRVTLTGSRVTGRVVSKTGDNFVLDSLPSLFTSATPTVTRIAVRTFPVTDFEEATIAAINVGDSVSVRGPLFKMDPTPVLLARKVRKR